MPAHYPPCFCLITQGSKSIAFGDDRLVYDAARFVVAAVDLPVTGVVLDASPEKPYLCVMLEIDTPELASLLLDPETPAQGDVAPQRGLFLGEASAAFVDAVWRLMRLLDTPRDIRALAPLAEREVLYRLVQSNAGSRLRNVVAGNGPARRIARSIAWLRSHYDGPLRVERLAEKAHMSPSSFHAHFKRVTAMSPLQYQKLLRLQEARRLLMTDAVDADDVRPVERVFVGDPLVSEAIYRLAKASREGRQLQEEVRVPGLQGGAARWLRQRA